MKTNRNKRLLAFLLCLVLLGGVFHTGGVLHTGVVPDAAAASGLTIPGKCPFRLEGGYLRGVELNTRAGEFFYFFGESAVVRDPSGKALSASDLVGTGCTLEASGGSAVILVSGDADGDGKNTQADCEIAKSLLINSETSAKYGFVASELTGDGLITTADYLKLKHAESCALLVQSAPATVKVPNLAGMTEAQAKDALQRAGLAADLRYTTEGAEGAAGKVAYQKTKAGVTAGEGAKICVVVTYGGDYVPLNYDRMKGMWLYSYSVASVIFKTTNGLQKTEADFRKNAETIVNNLARDGFNTLFLQLRPYGDAMYPSEVYPPSPYAANKGSLDYSGKFNYDPLPIFIDIAHSKGISIHAWLNPMRLMTVDSISTVPSKYRLGQWYRDSSKKGDYIVAHGSRYFLNPAYPETRQLVIDGCTELCRNYKIDGIHFDDYFYEDYSKDANPKAADLAFDQKAFDKLGSGDGASLTVRKEWRRQNINALVRDIHSAVKECNKDILFGISPAGNVENNQIGYLCADVTTWCSTPGYVDYIAPQVYWSFEHEKQFAKFNVCCNKWESLVTCDEVRLVIGLALHLAVKPKAGSIDHGWYDRKDNIKRMLVFTKNMDNCTGFIMFEYKSLYKFPGGEYNPATAEERANFMQFVPEW